MGKFFGKGDIFIYTAVLLLTAVCFLATFSVESGEGLTGIEITVDGELCFSCDFGGRWKNYAREYVTVEEKKDGIYVTVSKHGVNTVKITENSALMVSADCSVSKECVNNFPPITTSDQVIICMPNGVTVRGVGNGGWIPAG